MKVFTRKELDEPVIEEHYTEEQLKNPKISSEGVYKHSGGGTFIALGAINRVVLILSADQCYPAYGWGGYFVRQPNAKLLVEVK